jgi:hypothetical protein
LYQAKVKDDWGKGILTIGQGSLKIKLSMYPSHYFGETQWHSREVTSDQGYSSNDEDFEANRVHIRYESKPHLNNNNITNVGLGEYLVPCTIDDDSDKAIESWLTDKPVYGVTGQKSDLEPPYSTDDHFVEPPGFPDSTPIAKHAPQNQCCDMNIGEEGENRNIQISKHLSHQERRAWQRFFTKHVSIFAWSYKDLKGVPPKICEHHIHLEEGAKPVRQKQRRLNPKYSLLVKKEIEKLLEIGFIYPVPYSEWISPIVIVPKKNGKIRIC